MRKFTSTWLIVCFISYSCQAQKLTVDYLPTDAQVSFKAISQLSVKAPDVKINYGDDPLQFGWLWKPQIESTKPLIVLVHGGCWLNAYGVDHSFPMATALAQMGHPVWSVEYRRTGDAGGGWPGSFYDIKLALQQVNSLIEHGIKTEQPILMGHSAGGHLVLLAASELPENSFNQVIGLAAITDISRYALGENSCQLATAQFMNGLPHEKAKQYQQANLIYRKLPDSVLLLQGDADNIVPLLQSQLHQVERLVLAEAGHFDWIHPGTPAFTQLLKILKHEYTAK